MSEGTVIQECPKVQSLVAGLHTKAWFQVGDLETYVVTSTGGRQGCKLGGVIFNCIYERVLSKVLDRMHDAKVVLKLRCSINRSFWESPCESDSAEEVSVVDVTFVDDEAAMIMAESPRALDVAIDSVLEAFVEVFHAFGLIINWSKGKSEALFNIGANMLVIAWTNAGLITVSASKS